MGTRITLIHFFMRSCIELRMPMSLFNSTCRGQVAKEKLCVRQIILHAEEEEDSQGKNIPRKIRCGRCGELSNHSKKTYRNVGQGR